MHGVALTLIRAILLVIRLPSQNCLAMMSHELNEFMTEVEAKLLIQIDPRLHAKV